MNNHFERNKAIVMEKFRENLIKANFLDLSYPVQGSYILLPYGQKIKNFLYSKFIDAFEKKFNAELVELPVRIPQEFLKIHSNTESINESPNYADQHFLVTPDVPTIIKQPIFRGALDLGLYYLCKRTTKSFRQLPKTWLTRGVVLRRDSGILLARDPEIDFMEGITVFNPETHDSIKFMKRILQTMIEWFNFFEIPVNAVWKPSFAERFTDYKTIKLFTYIPTTSAVISVGIIHYFHNYPMKTLNIKIQNKNQINFYPSVINFGITQRALFAYLIHHQDELGFHMPPQSSFYDLSLVLRAKENEISQILEKSEDLLSELRNKYNICDYTTISDIKERLILSEIQGIPLRLEFGLKDINANKIKLFVRKTKDKVPTIPSEINKIILEKQKIIQKKYEIEFKDKANHISKWVESGLVTSKTLCSACQEIEETKLKIIGRDIDEINAEGPKKCENCGNKKAVIIFQGIMW
ncbi:MAG: hypothetical protein ACFFD1_10405 [Candidatus Thorarchaeota archaeon]